MNDTRRTRGQKLKIKINFKKTAGQIPLLREKHFNLSVRPSGRPTIHQSVRQSIHMREGNFRERCRGRLYRGWTRLVRTSVVSIGCKGVIGLDHDVGKYGGV